MNHEIDLVCLSHLRWNFVYQRPQHLLNRCARDRRVIFIEEARYLAPGSAASSFPGSTIQACPMSSEMRTSYSRSS